MGRYAFDIEASGLLDDSTVDYTASPWKLKDNFKVHCIAMINIDTNEVHTFVQEECYTKFKQFVIDNVSEIISFNGINYDMLVCKVAFGMDYTLGPDTWCGKPVKIDDLFIRSKTLNPDRPKHSLEYFGSLTGFPKIDWRADAIELGLITHNAPKGAEFAVYHPKMLAYNIQDVRVTIAAKAYLDKEQGNWPWEDALALEQSVAWIITRQSHRGFYFDKELALSCIEELDMLLEERRSAVEPNLPQKPLGKTALKEYIPCANQFLKNGKPNSNITKWCAKHGGTIVEEEDGKYSVELYGKKYFLPIPQEPIVTHGPSKIDDTTFIKGYLVEQGWQPSNYKERDLTVDTKKHKLSQEKFNETVQRYVEQTLSSPFMLDRCERVNATPKNLLGKLLGHDLKKPLKVYTNPTFTVGQDKEMDPHLETIAEQFPYVKMIVHYLTYRHRRNSILGGGLDPDNWEEEDDSTAKGFLANVRSDNRIPTPADTCGAASGRFLHKICVNVPRVTTLYGDKMRKLFSVGDIKKYAQAAYDFSGLEGRIEAHYCWRYDESKEYCNSLIQDKPNDVHTVTAKKISVVIAQAFPRQSAKAVKYCCTYGGQGPRVAKTIGCDVSLGEVVFNAFWEAAKPLADLKEKLTKYWETIGKKSFIIGLDKRKIMTRSKHALANSLFQSAGIICAKRTMVIQDRMLREEGLSVDFWTEGWKNKQYCQQMIHSHDEAQFEITKGLIKWRMFKEEEEAKQFLSENKEWVGPGKSEKGFYAALSPLNRIFRESVKETNNYYKMNIPLEVDPQYGRSWAECH